MVTRMPPVPWSGLRLQIPGRITVLAAKVLSALDVPPPVTTVTGTVPLTPVGAATTISVLVQWPQLATDACVEPNFTTPLLPKLLPVMVTTVVLLLFVPT